jgi:intergrase/recombinase
MVELEVPESVADFIEGRVPKSIGAKHYMVLRRQADKFYGKYADYLAKLRSTQALSQVP